MTSMQLKLVDFLAKWNNLKLILDCNLHFFYLVQHIQSVDITVQEAIRGASLLVSHLKSLRVEAMYNRFYDQTLKESQPLTEEPKLPRKRKLPKWLDSGSSAHQYQSAKDLYRHAYYEALDLISEEVIRRFEQEDLFLIKEIEVLMIKHANGSFQGTIPETINNFLKDDVDLADYRFSCACYQI